MLNDVLSQVIETAVSTDPIAESETLSISSPSIMPDPSLTDNRLDNQTNASVRSETQSLEELRRAYEELGKRLRQSEAIVSQPSSTAYRQSHLSPHQTNQLGVEQPVTLKDLSLFPHREFKVFGGQVGDSSSDINYSSLIKQIKEGVREGFPEAEIVRGALRIVKPGTFRDMLMHKDELSLQEVQGFLRSHLEEKATTEMFQELMCARQAETESPQQFLYRMIGLKQRLIFQSRQANSDVSYDPKTIREVFLHTVYQGLGVKYSNLWQRLRPFVSHSQVTDEEILQEVTTIISDENEHQRRLGQLPRQKTLQIQSAVVDMKGKTDRSV